MKAQQVSRWISAPLIIGAFIALAWLERRRPLRRAAEQKLSHEVRNLTVAAVSAAALQISESSLLQALTIQVERRRWGLLKVVHLPLWLEVVCAVLLMDYTLYLWHVLTHRVPFLWRFHVVHHVDLDLDASTALRFHFAELMISVPWRTAQVFLIGVSPLSLRVWQTCLFLSIMFHHSNVSLPVNFERFVNHFIVTPRMHGIHHSMVQEETNSNWSSGLTIWDWLHGTLKLNVPQDQITIGVPAYREPEEVTLGKILKIPFGEERPTWLLPDGHSPQREPLPDAYNCLAA